VYQSNTGSPLKQDDRLRKSVYPFNLLWTGRYGCFDVTFNFISFFSSAKICEWLSLSPVSPRKLVLPSPNLNNLSPISLLRDRSPPDLFQATPSSPSELCLYSSSVESKLGKLWLRRNQLLKSAREAFQRKNPFPIPIYSSVQD